MAKNGTKDGLGSTRKVQRRNMALDGTKDLVQRGTMVQNGK
jgi:hypothetical protein